MFDSVHATMTVTDLDRAERWYETLFERGPDTRPMAGLVEWRVGEADGVQVFADPTRAGRSGCVLGETDLDGAAARLRQAGVAHDGVAPGGGRRILVLSDPDGNQLVLIGD
ncbi:VOC family protein [Georgenia sp. Z1491]|uniref:VOC family protein n=1 Tax=Georgenia sp. Z1491 TaxID=3416707 RepID=UPI003CF9E052